jgi:nitroimidazol reductase NimA-like FMN-containing flavoprotein (pyridoxamine 5'-phosphate oxidase superfamily)
MSANGSISAMPQAPTERTRVRRHPERADYDLETVHAVLDEALLCTVSWVDDDGRVRALPTIQARIGDTLYLHGSRAARAWKAVAAGAEVCVVATVVDELVLARTSPAHSMNYRSAVVFGTAREVTARDELRAVAKAITRHVLPGREDDAAEPDDDDWRQTLILAMPIAEASAKVRTGPPVDEETDLELGTWAGTLPLRLVVGSARPAPDLRDGIEVPAYIPSSSAELPRP